MDVSNAIKVMIKGFVHARDIFALLPAISVGWRRLLCAEMFWLSLSIRRLRLCGRIH